MKLLLSSLLGLFLLIGAARSAPAQLGARSLEVEPFVGVLSFDDELFGENLSLESTLGFGGRLAYNFTENWALEGTFGLTPNAEPDFGDLDDDEDDDVGNETTVILAHGNLNYNFMLPNSKLVPFLTAGGGIANFNVDNDDQIEEESETDGLVNFGGGLKLFLSETIAVRGDIRDHLIFASRPNQDPGQPDDEEDSETTSNFEISGGVSFNF